MKLVYENGLGRAEMYGGGDNNIRISAVEGLCVPPYERRSYTSFDFDGAVESGRHMTRRTIAVGGDMKANAREAADVIKIFSEPGKLKILTNDFEREINVAACEAEYANKYNGYVKFALSLICDDPYFYDAEETRLGLYVREKLIDSTSVFPLMFSRRTTSASIAVQSDREVEPTIIILGGQRNGDGEGRIVIENILTGALFTLNYVPEEDEMITLDIKERTITSNLNGNLISYITDDSFMSDLVIGKNGAQFVTTGHGATGYITAYIIYKNKFLEAMV